MEFFPFIQIKTQDETIQNDLTIENLELISNQILGEHNKAIANGVFIIRNNKAKTV